MSWFQNNHDNCVTVSAYNAAIDTWERKYNLAKSEKDMWMSTARGLDEAVRRQRAAVPVTLGFDWASPVGRLYPIYGNRYEPTPEQLRNREKIDWPSTAENILARDLAVARGLHYQAIVDRNKLQEAVNALNGLVESLQTRNARVDVAADKLREERDGSLLRSTTLAAENARLRAQVDRLEARTSSTYEVEANAALRKENNQLRSELADWRSGRSFFSGPTPPKITNNTFGQAGYCACPGCSKYGPLPGHG
jgi:hypothetical protein